MKNLELLELIHKQVGDIFSEVKHFCQTSDSVYFIRGSLHKYDFINNVTVEICPKDFDQVIYIKLLPISGKICVVTPSKLHVVHPEGYEEVKTVEFPERIAAISWTPTEELFVTVSESGNVATFGFYSENWEIFLQGSSNVNAQVPDTVYVGWGSKDTQFRGSEGKLKPAQPSVQEEPVEDRKPAISWRGNGEMFVVNYWTDRKRKFVVFETPCKPLYRSEDCPGLRAPVAWRPAGNMIATSSEIANTQSIVIFEKNGQKRFSFCLDFDGVKEIKWSPCAQILTLYSEDRTADSQSLHLLTCSNYQWYEKQTLVFTSDNPLLDFDWLETSQFTFTLSALTRKEIVSYTFRSVVSGSSAVCGVINGKILQLTDFKDEIVPPVLFSKQIINDKSINYVIFNDNSLIAIVDSYGNLKIFDFNLPETPLSIVNLGEILGNLPQFPLAYHHFLFNENNIYFVVETDSEKVIYCLDFKTNELNFTDATDSTVRHLALIPGNFDSVTNMTKINDSLFMNSEVLSNSVQQIVKIINETSCYTCQLTSNCQFYVNNYKISDSVNSFCIFDSYLLYTTKLNALYCVRTTEESLRALLEDDSPKIYQRNIEQGANIIVAIPNSPKIILQLPRGNLETISCRLISIDILNRLLSDSQWDEVLRFLRLEKLNGNLLFDLNPERFLKETDKFVSSVKTVNELNAICLEFEEGNVLDSLYQNWGKSVTFPGKIQTIFKKIFRYLDEIDYLPYINTITIINLHFFTLRDALIYLQDLLRRSHEDLTLKKILIEAVNVLKTYGCDQEKLYSESLLLYDLDLAHFVAGCCQMDPRIYEPHINNLKNLPEVRRRYEINSFGKKPKIAIAYLLRCPEVTSDQILNFIRSHKVNREAYESCKTGFEHYKTVSRAFAEDLSRKGCHQEAGVVLKRGGLPEEALEEFKLGVRWREVLELLEELRVEEVEKVRVANEVAGKLVQRHLIKDAAILYEVYCKHYEMAVRILLENCYFEDALHLAKKYKRRDIIVSEIVPLLLKHKSYLEEKLNDLSQSYFKHKTRLAEVRQSKALKFNNCGFYEDERENDLFSDAGSVISRSTRSSRSRSSTASSRNRRKEEKKKQDLREGGFYEDIALIRALHYTIKEIYSKGEEVRDCCVFLLQESDVSFGEIKTFYDLYSKIDENIQSSLTEIWPPHLYIHNQTQDVKQMADLHNFEHLDVEFRTPPSGRNRVGWNLNLFAD